MATEDQVVVQVIEVNTVVEPLGVPAADIVQIIAPGPPGPRGNGAGATGPEGPPGPPGADGAIIVGAGNIIVAAGVPTPDIGNDGDLYINSVNSDLYVKDAGVWVLKANIRGSQGPQGNQGIEGPPGRTIYRGPNVPGVELGADGDLFLRNNYDLYAKAGGAWVLQGSLIGATGAQGPAGNSGASGATGPQGPAGAAGAQGATGAGVTGATGPQGPAGASGATGPSLPGATGPAGEPGSPGTQGPTGPQGATGPTGTGAPGANGATGATGPAGADGATGPSGPAGTAGASGAAGAAGASGATGPSGNALDGVNENLASANLALLDNKCLVKMNVATANNLTIQPNSSIAYPANFSCEFVQYGAGQTTIVAGSGVTIRTPIGLKTRVRYAGGTIVRLAADEWLVSGDLSA